MNKETIEEFHNFISATQGNICQITALKDGIMRINDTRHLLTMTAPYKYRSEPWTKVCSSDDWTVAALDLLGGRTGLTGQFKYSTLGIHILTGIITTTSGLSTVGFANQYLFSPLGIEPRTNYYAAIGNSGNVIYVNLENATVVAVAGTFKPTVFDRIDLIQKYIEPLLGR